MFKVLNECGLARIGSLSTSRGSIQTPSMLLSVRHGDLHGLTPDNYEKFLSNTGIIMNPLDFYGVCFEDGQNLAERFGFGQSPFVLCFPRDCLRSEYQPSNNDKGIVASLRPGQRQISPSAYIDQMKSLSPDVFAALWDQIAPEASEKRTLSAVHRTSKWLQKITAEKKGNSEIWAVITGQFSTSLRSLAIQKASILDPAGYILDGFENATEQTKELKFTLDCLDANKPRLLPGKFSPIEIFKAIEHGVDLFDSSFVWDLSLKGHALIWTTPPTEISLRKYTIIDLNNVSFREDSEPLMSRCEGYCGCHNSRGYIHHLLSENEIIGQVLLQAHNVQWMHDFFAVMHHHLNIDDKLPQMESIIEEV